MLNNNININKYDCLICIISGHGMNANIITSDYQLISQQEIYKIFCENYPIIRTIPRLFMWDCCDGSDEGKVIKKGKFKKINQNNNTGNMNRNINNQNIHTTAVDIAKGINDNDDDNDDENIDYKLATINACNLGFQSKICSVNGSYFINSFVEKTAKYLNNNKMQVIGDICNEIQKELGEEIEYVKKIAKIYRETILEREKQDYFDETGKEPTDKQ
eukprot:155356_1